MTEPTKAQATLATLKNANKHLTDLISNNESMNRTMGSTSNILTTTAALCGDLHIMVWDNGGYKSIKLKDHLNSLASTLEKGRL